MKEPNPSILNIKELRGRNVNEELHASSIRPLPPGPVCVQSTVQTLDKKKPQSTATNQPKYPPALVTAISPKSSSNLDTDQDEAVNKTLRKVVKTFHQTLLMTIGGTPNSNRGSHNDPHDKIVDRQPASTLNTNDNQRQSPPPI